MKYKFDSEDLIIGQIKELLYTFNLPKYTVYKDGDRLYEGKRYIIKNNIAICKNGSLVKLSPYIFGQEITNVTTTLPINSSNYDAQTHKYLGNYLRFIRDYADIDLMALYNCYGNERANNFNYIADSSLTINTDDDVNNYYLVPAKFGKTYTIGIDAQIAYDVCCIINTGDQVLDISKTLTLATHQKIQGSSFRNPAIFSTLIDNDLDDVKWQQYEDQLCLLIKVPKVVNSTLTVLEGDYSINCNTVGAVLNPITVCPDENKNIKVISKLSLMRNNAGISYPFADRLVEYLTGNAINPADDIYGNISSVQKAIYKDTIFRGVNGLWDNNITKRIYEILQKNSQRNTGNLTEINETENTKKWFTHLDVYYDLLGYCDKDVESIIGAL